MSLLTGLFVLEAITGIELSCPRCECKLSKKYLCEHCKTHLEIKNSSELYGNKLKEHETETIIFQGAKKATSAAVENIFISPKSSDWRKPRETILKMFDQGVLYDKLKLQQPALPKEKIHKTLQTPTLPCQKKQIAALDLPSDDSISTSFTTAFKYPYDKKGFTYVFPRFSSSSKLIEGRKKAIENIYEKLNLSEKELQRDSYRARTKHETQTKEENKNRYLHDIKSRWDQDHLFQKEGGRFKIGEKSSERGREISWESGEERGKRRDERRRKAESKRSDKRDDGRDGEGEGEESEERSGEKRQANIKRGSEIVWESDEERGKGRDERRRKADSKRSGKRDDGRDGEGEGEEGEERSGEKRQANIKRGREIVWESDEERGKGRDERRRKADSKRSGKRDDGRDGEGKGEEGEERSGEKRQANIKRGREIVWESDEERGKGRDERRRKADSKRSGKRDDGRDEEGEGEKGEEQSGEKRQANIVKRTEKKDKKMDEKRGDVKSGSEGEEIDKKLGGEKGRSGETKSLKTMSSQEKFRREGEERSREKSEERILKRAGEKDTMTGGERGKVKSGLDGQEMDMTVGGEKVGEKGEGGETKALKTKGSQEKGIKEKEGERSEEKSEKKKAGEKDRKTDGERGKVKSGLDGEEMDMKVGGDKGEGGKTKALKTKGGQDELQEKKGEKDNKSKKSQQKKIGLPAIPADKTSSQQKKKVKTKKRGKQESNRYRCKIKTDVPSVLWDQLKKNPLLSDTDRSVQVAVIRDWLIQSDTGIGQCILLSQKNAPEKKQKLPAATEKISAEVVIEENAPKPGKSGKKNKALKKLLNIPITRPEIIMYDINPIPIKKVKKKIEEKRPELMNIFPTEEELDLGAYNKILKLKTADEFIKTTKIVKNLPEYRDVILYTEPQSQMYQVKHDLVDIDYVDDEMEEEKYGTSGAIKYVLSDRSFIDKGWTQLPVEKVVRKMLIYRSHPAQPEFDWFRKNKDKGIVYYDTGEKLAEVDATGYGRWYYKNGRIAMEYHKSENAVEKERVIVYSDGERDENGKKYPVTPLAMFDKSGNGIVFDHNGKIRINFNQSEGMVHDPSIGPSSHWKWHTLNEPPLILKSSVETFGARKDPNILKLQVDSDDDKPQRIQDIEMLTIEFQNFVKEESKRQKQKFCPFRIKMKALKINKQFSLNILDQTKIYLKFRDGLASLKINLGIYLDPEEVVDTELTELGIIENCVLSQAKTDSKTLLQEHYNKSKKTNQRLSLNESRMRNVLPVPNADRMLSRRARLMHHPLLYAYSGLCKCARNHTYNYVNGACQYFYLLDND